MLTRREVLGYGAAGVVVLAAPGLAEELAATPGSGTFRAVSAALTGKTSLNPIISDRIFLALGDGKREFLRALESLAEKVGQPAAGWTEDDRALAADILSAWYLGQVGEGADAKVITYEHSLMYAAVAGALAPRTFCASEPGQWASKPA